MHFSKLAIPVAVLLQTAFTHAASLERRLTRSKLNEFTGPNCDGASTYNHVNVQKGGCIDIDATTHSIFLARGSGMYARNMYAYAETGCPANSKIERFYEHDSGSACMNVDSQMLGLAGTEKSSGRLMSVKFTGT